MKRIFLFILTNILVLLTISISLSILGIGPYLSQAGIDYSALLAFCGVFGFVGAFVSLALSRWMAKMMMGVKVIDPQSPGGAGQRELVQTVHRLAQKAGLTVMPEVGFYQSPEINAFATGPSRNRSLVAVSTGLLDSMDDRAIEGVLGHEVAHIANGDMVTMTLIQGVVNTFVMFFARVAAWAVSNAMSGDRENRGPNPFVHFMAVIAFEILFSLLGSIVVAYFSRRREFRADAGSAKILNRETMIHSLRSLQAGVGRVEEAHPSMASLKISGNRRTGFLALFASHPPLEERIRALESRPL